MRRARVWLPRFRLRLAGSWAAWSHVVPQAACSGVLLLTACEGREPPVHGEVTSSTSDASLAPPDASRTPDVGAARLLVFTKTTGFRHASIADAITALTALAAEHDWPLEVTEDATSFNDEDLARFNVVLFASTTGDVLDSAQEAAMERFIAAGNGFVGVHSAADTEYDWAWYGSLVGAYFAAHPAVQPATLHVVHPSHPATAHLPSTWTRTDEWYGFRAQPDPDVHVLLTIDEASYAPGESAMGYHPVAWYRYFGGGRSFYTALGHTSESYREPEFLAHLVGGIRFACCDER